MLYNNINGLHGNITELGVAAVGFEMLFCVETKVTQHRHVSELMLPGFRKPTQLLRGTRPNGLGLAMYVRDGVAVTVLGRFVHGRFVRERFVHGRFVLSILVHGRFVHGRFVHFFVFIRISLELLIVCN